MPRNDDDQVDVSSLIASVSDWKERNGEPVAAPKVDRTLTEMEQMAATMRDAGHALGLFHDECMAAGIPITVVASMMYVWNTALIYKTTGLAMVMQPSFGHE
jgi:hypothetical protein